jgi:hypothetical protein
MKADRIRDRFMPWGGLALGTLGGGLAHQIGAATTFQDCTVGSPLVVLLGIFIGLALIGLGAFASWRVFSAKGEAPPRRLIATVSLMAAVIFALAVILPAIAALVIPRCWA